MEAKFYNNLILPYCALLYHNRAFDKHNGPISNVKRICIQVYFSLYLFNVVNWTKKPTEIRMSQNFLMLKLRRVYILKTLQVILRGLPVIRTLFLEVRGVCGPWEAHNLPFLFFEWPSFLNMHNKLCLGWVLDGNNYFFLSQSRM